MSSNFVFVEYITMNIFNKYIQKIIQKFVLFLQILGNQRNKVKESKPTGWFHLQIIFFQVERKIMKKSVCVAQKVKVCSVDRRPAEVDNTFLYASDDIEWKGKNIYI